MMRWKQGTCWKRGFAAAVLALGVSAMTAQATTYKAPNGLFDMAVPAGWTTEWDAKLDQVTLRRGSTIASVMGLSMPHESAAYAETFLDMAKSEFRGQCKGSDELEHGPARLAGLPADSFLMRCPEAPASVAGTTTAWAGTKVLLVYTVIAPIRTYGDDVAALDAIGASIHLTGTPVATVAAPGEDMRVAEVKRACRAGSFTQEECSRRIGQAMSNAQAVSNAPAAANGARFEDADHAFSLQVPAGWKATQENKNGMKGVQLRHGADWIALMQAPAGAASAKDAVLRFETGFVKPGDPQPPFGAVGVVQIFGNGVELDYDSMSSLNDNGRKVDSKVIAIGDISGKGPWVLMLTSIAEGTDTVSLGVAQSVHVQP